MVSCIVTHLTLHVSQTSWWQCRLDWWILSSHTEVSHMLKNFFHVECNFPCEMMKQKKSGKTGSWKLLLCADLWHCHQHHMAHNAWDRCMLSSKENNLKTWQWFQNSHEKTKQKTSLARLWIVQSTQLLCFFHFLCPWQNMISHNGWTSTHMMKNCWQRHHLSQVFKRFQWQQPRKQGTCWQSFCQFSSNFSHDQNLLANKNSPCEVDKNMSWRLLCFVWQPSVFLKIVLLPVTGSLLP